MREAFFPLSVLEADRPAVGRNPECGACGMLKNCHKPNPPPSGEGRKKILVVTDEVTRDEELADHHLAGGFGRMVQDALGRAGVDLRKDCWATAARTCAGRPHRDAIRFCRPNLFSTVYRLKPEVIILLGVDSVRSLVGGLWGVEGVGSEARWVGWQIPHVGLNAWICPTYHPRTVRMEKVPVAEAMFHEHLAKAAKLKGRPYAERPAYQDRVRCVTDVREAGVLLSEMHRSARTVAFDYETTCLRPESTHARIVCCSISDGKTSVAYPWHGPAVAATKRLLSNSAIRKVGSNIKFEDRWTRRHLGVEVRGWHWDTVLAAHVLGNNTKEKDICSIKFQAPVRLGVEPWDRKVGPFLKAESGGEKDGNAKNRIEECPLPDLLRYNALDSLYEFLTYERQYRELKSLTTIKDMT